MTENKRKLLIIIESLEVGGGAEKITSFLTKSISKEFTINILTFKHLENIYQFNGTYYTLNDDLNKSKIIKYFNLRFFSKVIKMYKLILSISPNLIISVADYTNILTILMKLIFQIKIPLIIWIHCNPLLVYRYDARFFNFLLKIFYRLKVTNKIITISKEVRRIYINNYHIQKNKIETIYNGIDLEKIWAMKKEDISNYKNIFNNPDLIKFITIGRLTQEKGHKFLIEAFSKVKKQIENSILIIIGIGTLLTDLKKIVKAHNLEKDIIFLGYQKNPFKYLAKSDIFVLSSIMEGLPTVLLEALACEIPIISTNCETGPKEILDNGNYGVLTKVKDANDLANKMIMVVQNKHILKRLSEISLERVKIFEIERFNKDWTYLIKSFI